MHPFLLNLPLIFADSESCGFTVMTLVEKKSKKTPKNLSLHCPLNGIKATVDKSIPPCWMYGCLEWYSVTTLVNWALVLVALDPLPAIALVSPKTLLENAQAFAHTAVSPSPLPHHTTKCLPNIVLHIRMLPRLPQRTKQPYAKQAAIPTYIVMRRTV